MFKFKTTPHFLATLFLLIGLFPHYVPAQGPAKVAAAPPDAIDKVIATMTLEQKVGQLFMVGFTGTSLDPKMKALISKVKPGAFLLFKRNITSAAQVKSLNKELFDLALKTSTVRPLIAVDQEGGVVSRIPMTLLTPSALALGQTHSAPLAEAFGEEIGHAIKNLGFSMNLAPVLDLSDPQQPSFIGVRSLGGNPKNVGDLGYSISKGLIQSQIVPTAKHFPGLGSVMHDPHATLITSMTSQSDFFSTDLKPFQKFAELGPESAIMLSHLSYPALDPTNVPALFSEKIVKDLLRTKLGFRGVILTDDIMMEGASQFAEPGEAAVMALKAGVDIVMLAWSTRSQEKAFLRVKQAIEKNEIPLADLHQKLRRILLAKSLSVDRVGQRALASANQSDQRLREIEQGVLDSNLKSQEQKLAQLKASESFCVFSSSSAFIESFKRGTSQKLQYFVMTTATSSSVLENLFQKNHCGKAIISIYGKKTAVLVESLSPEIKSKVLLVNLNAPISLNDDSAYLAVLNLYFAHLNAGQKIAQHISTKKSQN